MEQQQIDFELEFVWKLLRWLGIDPDSQNQVPDGSKFKKRMLIFLSILSIFPKLVSMYVFRARVSPGVHYNGIINRLLMITLWWYLYFKKKDIRRISTKLDRISNPSFKINLLMQTALISAISSHIVLILLSFHNRDQLVFFKFGYTLERLGRWGNALIVMNINQHFFVPLFFPAVVSYIPCAICCRLRDALETVNFYLCLRIKNQIPFQANALVLYDNVIKALVVFVTVFFVPSLLIGYVLLSNVMNSLERFADGWINGHTTATAVLEQTLILIPSACSIVAMVYYASQMNRTKKDIEKHLHRLHLRLQGTHSAERFAVEAINRRKVHIGGGMMSYKACIPDISFVAVVAFTWQYYTEKHYFPLSL